VGEVWMGVYSRNSQSAGQANARQLSARPEIAPDASLQKGARAQ